tara:strand:- start:2551 stop:2799 length:249 start_codon:yes stop_codon:yes gene_type:complete
MPSGTYQNTLGRCKICKKNLRPLYKNNDWETRKFHVSCFKELISDIKNYHLIAYDKYGHEKTIGGIPISEAKKQKNFTIKFE